MHEKKKDGRMLCWRPIAAQNWRSPYMQMDFKKRSNFKDKVEKVLKEYLNTSNFGRNSWQAIMFVTLPLTGHLAIHSVWFFLFKRLAFLPATMQTVQYRGIFKGKRVFKSEKKFNFSILICVIKMHYCGLVVVPLLDLVWHSSGCTWGYGNYSNNHEALEEQ